MSSFDVAVVGRGAIGTAAALAFVRAGWRVALVAPAVIAATATADSSSVAGTSPALAAGIAPAPVSDTVHSPSDWDQRVYALSPASRRLLEGLGVWHRMPVARIAPVYDMRIFRETAAGEVARSEVHLDAYQGRVEALAWIVENRALQQALDSALADAARDPAGGVGPLPLPGAPAKRLVQIDGEVTALTLPEAPETRRSAVLDLDGGGRVIAALVVAADGTGSPLRAMAGIDHELHEFDETAIVANFAAEVPHRDCAWQWFGADGVVALLPLPSDDLVHARPAGDGKAPAQRSRVSLVWSAPAALAGRALGQSPEWLAARVRELSHGALGALTPITAPAYFPLRSVRCREVVKPGFVLLGDAAHAVHPMAGQGMNLGFGDVRELVELVAARPRAGAAAPPDWLTLRRYARTRREPVVAMQLALDGLHHAFGDLPAPLVGLRDLGWELVARSPWLKRRMIAHAVS
ncbi:MAG: FAD-dependent monooxygenase [Lautropia sp.]